MRSPSRLPHRARQRQGRARGAPNLLVSIHKLSELIGRAFYGEIATEFALGVVEWRVLLTLAERPDATSAEIASAWAMEKMAVSRAVRRLEGMGLVSRRQDRRDKRRRFLRLTAAGRRHYRRVLPVASARYREIVSCLDPADVASLRRLLDRLIAQTARLAVGSKAN
jgi:DNA-binding MarR family transcriptional regulator